MKKESTSALSAGIVALVLVYVFFFTKAGKDINGWVKFLIWLLAVPAAWQVGYALGKEEKPAADVTIPNASLSLN